MNFILTILITSSSLLNDSTIFTIDDRGYAPITQFEVLPDKNYDIEQIASDPSLIFRPRKTLRTDSSENYWVRIRINNPGAYSKKFYLFAYPIVRNTLYELNQDSNKWISHKAGIETPSGLIQSQVMPLTLASNHISTVYVKMNVSSLRQFDSKINARFYLHQEKKVLSKAKLLTTILMVVIGVITVLFLYNAYVYYFFKDRTYLYYLFILIGGLIYITGLHGFFRVIFPWSPSSFYLAPSGVTYWSDLNTLFTQLGIILVIGAFSQMTRAYLKTKELVPVLDKVLKYLSLFFIYSFLLSGFATLKGWSTTDHTLNVYFNLLIMIIILLMFYIGFATLKKSFKPAKYYLIAHSIPLIFMLMLAVYFFWFKTNADEIHYLPSLAIISQALAFAIALVARMQLLKDELSKKKLELRLKKVENEKLQDKLEYNQREIASSTMYQSQRNKMLVGLKDQVHHLASMLEGEAKGEAKKIKSTINSSISLDSDWEKFKLHFEQVHSDFFKDLKINYPNLTQNEIRLSAYFHINLSVKEIAALTNISPESVRKAKTRLNKKLREQASVSA